MDRKYIIAVLVGVLSAGTIVFVLEMISHVMYPIDGKAFKEALEGGDPNAFKTFVLSQPLGSFISIVVAHAIGILGGLMISRLIYRKAKMSMYIITAIMLLANTVNLLVIPHPTWFPFADIGLSLIVAIGFISSRKVKTA